MKKFMLVLFVLAGILGYSNSKCELIIRTVPEQIVQQFETQVTNGKAKYSFKGVDKKNKNLYYYLLTYTNSDGRILELYNVIDVSNGNVYIQNMGENQKLQKLTVSGDSSALICK